MSNTQNFFPKMHGYTPDPKKEAKEGNRLDRYNPHEFRVGMTYELTEIGCLRLQESTPEEREKATEKVLKNLEEHNGYYTALMTYESLYKEGWSGKRAEGVTKPSFNSWLKEQEEELKTIVGELEKASEMHASQAKRIKDIVDETDDSELKEENIYMSPELL